MLVADLDLLDGTPILDIKPYVPEFDARLDVRIGWYAYAACKEQQVVADERFTRASRASRDLRLAVLGNPSVSAAYVGAGV